ncbi:MAG: hypothetical protein QOI58_386 [Thermoanaerobaculia bacterium]|jgi:hypothetical protein|nr:hypothetical protein [Thermoanaerobaculia bacterium]
MKRFILCVSLVVFSQSLLAAVPMARFSKVIDSRTIVVERIDGTEVVHLTNVAIPAEDEQAARDYLTEKLTGSFVYVENGNVYRSPDALFINRELAYGAYSAPSLKMRVFGEINPGTHPQKAPGVREPMQVPKPAHHARRR